MVQDMRVTMHLEESMEQELINGVMALNILENGKRTKYQDLEYIPGQMEESMKENGEIIIWKVQVFMSGMMEGNMKDNIRMTKNMDLESMDGQTADVMKVIGTKANSMAQELIQLQRIIKSSKVFGKMVREQNGLMKPKWKLLV